MNRILSMWIDEAEFLSKRTKDTANEAQGGESVNHPAHYTQGNIECIEAIKSALTDAEFRGYCKGNAIKYIWRERLKGQDESVQKATWYMNQLLEGKAMNHERCAVTEDLNRYMAECDRSADFESYQDQRLTQMMKPGGDYDPYKPCHINEAIGEFSDAQMDELAEAMQAGDASATLRIMNDAIIEYWEYLAEKQIIKDWKDIQDDYPHSDDI